MRENRLKCNFTCNLYHTSFIILPVSNSLLRSSGLSGFAFVCRSIYSPFTSISHQKALDIFPQDNKKLHTQIRLLIFVFHVFGICVFVCVRDFLCIFISDLLLVYFVRLWFLKSVCLLLLFRLSSFLNTLIFHFYCCCCYCCLCCSFVFYRFQLSWKCAQMPEVISTKFVCKMLNRLEWYIYHKTREITYTYM